MRILLVSHGLPPESVGGVEQHVDGLARALVAAGHQVHVYSRTDRAGARSGELVDDATPVSPYRVTRVAYRYDDIVDLRGLYASATLDRAFDAFVSAHAFDVAHVHHMTGLSTGVLDALARHAVPRVLTLHDYWLICPRGQMWRDDGTRCDRVEPATCATCLRPAFGALIPAAAAGAAAVAEQHRHAIEVLARADALIAPSARVAAPFVRAGAPDGRIKVVENGVDVEALAALAPPDAHRAGALRIGYLGALIPSKGLDVLCRAVASLPAGLVELTIRGNATPYHGDAGFLTRVFGDLRVDRTVRYEGPYRTADLPAILGGIDLLAAPALWNEAFGLTVREALAAARPVVVSRVGGLQDAIDDGVEGRLVPPGDVAALATSLRELATDRDTFATMVAAARRRPIRGFGPMAAELVDVYEAVRS